MFPLFLWLLENGKNKAGSSLSKKSSDPPSSELVSLSSSNSQPDDSIPTLPDDLFTEPIPIDMLWVQNLPLLEAEALYNKILESLGDKPYDDPTFPSNDFSITPNLRLFPKTMNIGWRRASSIYYTFRLKLFNEDMGPSDIKQGSVGDCYFLSCLSVLAERPALIQRLFLNKKINANGCYSIWLCDSGEWINLMIDDYIPTRVSSGKPAFAQSKNKEIWVLLLEKAFAKMFGSYYAIQAGVEGEAFRALTGAPVEYHHPEEIPESERSKALWEFITSRLDEKYVLTVSSKVSKKKLKQSVFGIVGNHSYSILKAKEVVVSGSGQKGSTEKEKVKLVKMRNPWGSVEWSGEWGDESEKLTPEVKNQIGYNPKFFDGTFWIPLEAFVKHFGRVCCCKIRVNYLYRWVNVKQTTKENMSVVQMSLKEGSYIYLSVVQKSKRHYKGRKDVYYDYSWNRVVVCKMDGDGNCVESKMAKYYGKQCNTVEGWLEAGNYMILVEFEWVQNVWNGFVVTSYSEKEVIELKEIERETDFKLLMAKGMIKAFVGGGGGGVMQKLIGTNPEEPIYRYEGSLAGWGFLYYSNLSMETVVKDKFEVPEGNAFAVLGESEGQTVVLGPQKEAMVIVRKRMKVAMNEEDLDIL